MAFVSATVDVVQEQEETWHPGKTVVFVGLASVALWVAIVGAMWAVMSVFL